MFKNENTKEEKTTVLGITFNSEEERREYFREELRKKLPELKQMEGFPIGEDEDILKLSDPPYYTACPNPWLNDFIEEWEEEKKDLEEQGKRVVDFKVSEPYAADVSEGKNNPIYNAHSYHTKVPHPAIMRYILHYTQPGDIVYDGFAGTGMTGVAASMCGNPGNDLKVKIENEQNVIWGKRHSICSDLSPYASFISSNYNISKHNDFRKRAKDVLSNLKEKLGWMYKTNHNNIDCVVFYYIWSDVIICPHCNNEYPFTELAVDFENWEVKDEFECIGCSSIISKKSNVAFETVIQNNEIFKTIKKVPVKKNISFNGRRMLIDTTKFDIVKLSKVKQQVNEAYNNFNYEIMEGEKTRELSNKGLKYYSQIFFERNLLFLNELSKLEINNDIKFLITSGLAKLSYLNRYTPKLPGPLNGTIYMPSIICEYNPFWSINGKITPIEKAFNLIDSNSCVSTQSATATANIKSNSIDYIFTDPPFGSNIMYSELNFLHEGFLKVQTNNKEEAIQNRVQNKTLFDYQNLMSRSFAEYNRVLKPGKWITVEFSNTNASVWNSIQTSLQNAGFIVANVSSIDKKQGSFNAVNSVTAVKQDLIISCYKPSPNFYSKFNDNQNKSLGIWDFIEEHLKHLPIHLLVDNSTTAIVERSPKILFDRLIAFYVQKNLPVPIDAVKFQKGLRERFIERDGMFFTNEQVQEYDKKKKENPEFIQLSLLVSSEQDGVLWLKSFLADKSLTYQDIQPQWIQALAGVRKGDMIPELSTILEENFLKDASGKWYAPDPENEADLEKLRKGRLLRLFEGYKKEIENPRTKIKEVRVEALREGFKQCYQDKDFKTIVTVGDRIPNNLLMEDEVLLQFYDIASSRV